MTFKYFIVLLMLYILYKFALSQVNGTFYEWSNDTNSFKTINMDIPSESLSLKPYLKPEDFYSNGQCKQDFYVTFLLGKKQNGFFVDLATNDWKFQSNT